MTAKRIINWLIKQKVISEDERELYEYAYRSLLYLFTPFIIAIVVGSILHSVMESVIMVIPFVILRSFCGGFHMKNIRGCLIVSSLSFLGIISLSFTPLSEIFYCILTVVCAISISVISPVTSKNKEIASDEISKYKIITVILVSIMSILIFVMYINNNGYIAKYLSLGLFLTAALQWPCLMRKYN